MTRYYAREYLDDGAIELSTKSVPPQGSNELYNFEAATWEEAMAIHHLRQGFEPYRPGGDAADCPQCGAVYYPEGSGECWRCGPRA